MHTVEEDFGSIRSLVQVPSWHNWRKLCGLLDRHRVHWETPIFQEQVIPYLDGHFAHWPQTVLRYAQHAWIEATLLGDDIPQLRFANAMQFVSQRVNTRRLNKLFSSPYLSGMQVVNLADLDMKCDSALVIDLVGSPHLGKLRGLSIAGGRMDGLGLELLALADSTRQLQWLDLSGNQLRKIDPLLQEGHLEELEELLMFANYLDMRALQNLAKGNHLPGLRKLDLRQNKLMDSSKDYMKRCALSKQLRELLL